MTSKHKRILLMDSEQAWLDFSKATLQEAGYSVVTASSPAEISELLSKSTSKFNLILVDLKYAEEDGDLLGQLAQSGLEGRCIVVLFPTEMTPPQMVEFFRMKVIQDCVDKQYDRERLLFLVENQLQSCGVTL